MKKLLYVFLAMTVAFAMVACSNSSTDTTPSGPVYTVTVTPATPSVAKGDTQQFAATVSSSAGGSVSQAVSWAVTGGISGTSISTTGLLTVAAGEAATSLTVRATSSLGANGTATVTVVPAGTKTVTAVVVTPATPSVPAGDTQQFTVDVQGSNLTSTEQTTALWAVTGGGAGTSISSSGLLTVALAETATSLTVTATSNVAGVTGVDGTATVTVVPAGTVTVTHIAVSGPSSAEKGTATATYSAVVHGANSPSQTVTWSVVGGISGTSIDSGGVLTVAAGETAVELTVVATSTVTGFETVSGEATVTVTGGSGPIIDTTGAEKLFLENGAYALFKFTIPDDGNGWEDYQGISVDYLIYDEYWSRDIRGARLLGPYYEEDFDGSKGDTDYNGTEYITLNNWGLNQHILDNRNSSNPVAKANIGATAADTWFTNTHSISGSDKHGDFNVANLPADDYKGDIYFALGLTGGYGSSGSAGNGILHLIRNVKLVGYEGVEDVVSEGAGDGPSFVSYADPVVYSWRGAPDAQFEIPSNPPGCDCLDTEIDDCDCDIWDCNCHVPALPAVPAEQDYIVNLAEAKYTGLLKNPTAWEAAYQSSSGIPIDFPTQGDDQLDVRSYASVTITAVFSDADGDEITAANGLGQLIWTKDIGSGWYSQRIVQTNNLGMGKVAIHADVLAAGTAFKGIVFQNSTVDVAFIEITGITFHKAEE